ncbi:CD276 antigen-like isoform X2 [Xiphophorus maculatus]|uniref:CD276 antigen-like isoform X2 n=1 Tax=Xiphophorus maculatus TaxID=8083 RepID=UPI000C6D6E43|nr:CD276 antigen-like isoform X2 [Xiphophorus maculatus]
MELIPVILLLLVCPECILTENTKDPDLVCPSKAIGAVKSKDVLLPCHLEPPMDASAETVKWKQGKHVVHFHQGGKHNSSKQWEHFRERTSLSSEGLTEGNLSLTLSSVNHLDEEPNVVCPSEYIEVRTGDDVVLPCRLETHVDTSGKILQWRHGNNIVYEKEKHNTAKENERNTNRLSLFPEELAAGNLSLKISSVRLEDNGKYQCCLISESIERNCSIFVTVVSAGDRRVVGPHEPVAVEVGQVAVLPCHLEPPSPLSDLTLEWTVNNSKVHIYRSHRDDPSIQDERFKNRTSLFKEELVHGNISLILTNVTKEDAGNYFCFVPKLVGKVQRVNVTLNIAPPPEKHKNDEEPCPCKTIIQHLGLRLGLGLGFGLPLAFCIIICLWMKYVGRFDGFAEQARGNQRAMPQDDHDGE